jgi:hypothetical protein
MFVGVHLRVLQGQKQNREQGKKTYKRFFFV